MDVLKPVHEKFAEFALTAHGKRSLFQFSECFIFLFQRISLFLKVELFSLACFNGDCRNPPVFTFVKVDRAFMMPASFVCHRLSPSSEFQGTQNCILESISIIPYTAFVTRCGRKGAHSLVARSAPRFLRHDVGKFLISVTL